MPDDNVIDLAARRRRKTVEMLDPNASALVRMTSFGWADFRQCDGFVHWFPKVPGPCECGQETWDGDL